MILSIAHSILDRSPEATLCVDTNGQLLYGNEAACQSLGYTPMELQRGTLSSLAPEMDDRLWKELVRQAKQESPFAVEFPLRAKEGRLFPAEVSVHFFQEASGDYFGLFFRDTTEHKRFQELKNEFISTVSHELRTPMTVIREGVSQVLEGLRGEINPQQHRALTLALVGIDRLRRIINDILDISKIEAGKLTLRREWIDFRDLVQEVGHHFQTTLQERGLELQTQGLDQPMSLYADRDKMIQVLTNLVSNAIKFTGKGSVTIKATNLPHQIECAVSDTGLGIAPEDLKRVFNKFEQFGPAPVSGESGTGLGLSISKGIIELHGGTIRVSSELEKGTSFVFTLPKLTPKEIYRLQLTDHVRQAAKQGSSFSHLHFCLTGPIPPSAIDHLEQVIRTNGGRRTDILVKDSNGIFLGMPAMVEKEAQRLADQIRAAFQADDKAASFPLNIQLLSFPQAGLSEKEFLQKALANETH